MRLSEWRAAAPHRDAAAAKVAAVVDPVLNALGAGPDPHCWVAWGDEPGTRYAILVATDPGLIVTFVRPNVPGEGPRASTKLVRWNRVVIGELTVETQGGHRMLSFQLEGQVLRGADVEADRVAAFALRVIAAIDGRPLPPVEEKRPRTAGRSDAKAASASGAALARSGNGTKQPAKTTGQPAGQPAAKSRGARPVASGSSR
ncbi:MAG: hypothetical protein QOF49_289 [Chloroflexota bacterium]|jgi:hypothetical protein|nr:hypothetical protein [Chloroflexota bacterium]